MDEARALDAVLDVAIAALSSPAATDPLPLVLPALQSSVGADAAGYYEHLHHGQTTTILVSPTDIWARLPFTNAPTEVAARLHPGVKHLITRAPTNPFAVTDLVSEQEWHNSELGALMRPEWGRNHQLMLPVYAPSGRDRSDVFVLGRLDQRFSAVDRALSCRLMRILTVVVRHRTAVTQQDVTLPIGQLTQREQLVLTLTARGLNACVVGAQLGISPRTVHKHLEHAYRKLDVHDRYQARALVLDRGHEVSD